MRGVHRNWCWILGTLPAWIALFLLLLAATVRAEGYRLVTYGADEGLEVEFSKGVSQDSLGFIWVATDQSLYRLDGIRFQTLREGLPSPFVKSFYYSGAGQLHVVTDEGVALLDPDVRHPRITPLIPGATQLTDSTLYYPKHGIVDRSGAHWVSEQRAVVRWKDGQFKRYSFPAKDHSYDFLRSFRIVEDPHGRLFVLSIHGTLYHYNPAEERFDELPLPSSVGQVADVIVYGAERLLVGGADGLFELVLPLDGSRRSVVPRAPGLDISSLVVDEGTNLYIGTWAHGLHRLDLSERRSRPEKIDAFQYIKVNDLYYSEGNLWISTDIGISLLQRTHFHSILRSGMNTFIHDIQQGADGNIYFCDGARIMRQSLHRGAVVLDTVYQNVGGTILQFQFLRGGMYVSTSKGEVLRVAGGEVVETIQLPEVGRPIMLQVKDQVGNLYVAQSHVPGMVRIDSGHRVVSVGPEKGLPYPVQAMLPGKEGLYVAFTNHDTLFLSRYDTAADSCSQVLAWNADTGDQLFEVNDLAETLDRTFLIATTIGLFRWDGNGLVPVELDRPGEEDIRAVAVHPNGDVWVGTRDGVIHISRQAKVRYGLADGLPARTISRGTVLIDNRGRIWLGTSLGAAWSDNTSVAKRTPQPLLLRTVLDGQPVELDDGVSITPSSIVAFDITSLSYPGRYVNFQHRVLIRGDEEWSEPNRQRTVFLHRLAPGSYSWQVRAIRQGNYTWSEPLEIPLVVKGYWYLSWWAILSTFLLILAVYALVIRMKTRKLIREKENLERLIAQRTRQALDQLERSKNAEIEAQQMRTANRIAGTIAHEFNNPLAIIQGSLDLLTLSELGPEHEKAFERIRTQSERMRDLVKKLLKIQELREIDYAAGMKILDIHSSGGDPHRPASSRKKA